MSESSPQLLRQLIDRLYAEESRRVFASLVRLLKDFDLAEEAMQDAFAAAIKHWPETGIPENPRAWLISTGRFQAIDRLRRQGRLRQSLETLRERRESIDAANRTKADLEIEDDRLRLIFTCCHPAIDPLVQIPLTLREVCGLTTDEIASAFLVPSATMAQRIVRGKAKIRDAGIPIEIPAAADFPERLQSVLRVVYLVYSEGYSATSGESLTREELSGEAIRLGRLLMELWPDPEVFGLLALMLLQESRRAARVDAKGDLILLEDQNRSLWDRAQIVEGAELVERAIRSRRFGPYTLQAAIAAVHAQSASPRATDWREIEALYGALGTIEPSPIIELNQAVAAAMHSGAEVGLRRIDAILARGDLRDYRLAHAARADLLRRLGRLEQAVEAYQTALALARQVPERRFLQRRLAELSQSVPTE